MKPFAGGGPWKYSVYRGNFTKAQYAGSFPCGKGEAQASQASGSFKTKGRKFLWSGRTFRNPKVNYLKKELGEMSPARDRRRHGSFWRSLVLRPPFQPVEGSFRRPWSGLETYLNLTLSPGKLVKQFTGRDVVSIWNVLEVFLRASSHCGRKFLQGLF